MRLDFVVHHHNYTIDPEIRYPGLLLLFFFVYIYFHDINICKNLPQKQNYLVKNLFLVIQIWSVIIKACSP